jgi:hypothetical protein
LCKVGVDTDMFSSVSEALESFWCTVNLWSIYCQFMVNLLPIYGQFIARA